VFASILGFSLKVKLSVPLLCVYVCIAWKGCLRNDLYCVGQDFKPYSPTLPSGTELVMLVDDVQIICGIISSYVLSHSI